MDHAEVRAWLEEAFFRPGTLRKLEEDDGPGPAPDPVREHLSGCDACTRELRALRATSVALDVGLGPPPAAEERMLARVRQVGGQRSGQRETSLPGMRQAGRFSVLRAAAVLALIVVAFGSGVLLGFGWPESGQPDGPRLANATAAMGQILKAPDVRQVWLEDESSVPAGVVVHSSSERRLAVIASGFARPDAAGYECFLERDGDRTWIGPMHFEGETGFWAGPMEQPADAGRPGDRFVVIASETGPPVLSGEFR